MFDLTGSLGATAIDNEPVRYEARYKLCRARLALHNVTSVPSLPRVEAPYFVTLSRGSYARQIPKLEPYLEALLSTGPPPSG